MSEETPNLNLPYIMPSQAQKHVTHNEAIRALDALVQLSVVDRDRNDPPAVPADGDRHLVAATPAGDWSGHADEIAAFQDGAWAFFTPRTGWLCHVAADGILLIFDGSQWSELAPPISSQDLQNLDGVGINASADAVNRLTVSASASLFNNEGAGHQIKVNKNAPGDTASLLFQTDWSGRAEMGLAGNDDFTLKVSADGGTWLTGLVIDASSGAVSAPAGILAGGPLGLGAYAISGAPDAAVAGAGAMIFVTDEVSGATPAFSDGTQWRRVADRAVISA